MINHEHTAEDMLILQTPKLFHFLVQRTQTHGEQLTELERLTITPSSDRFQALGTGRPDVRNLVGAVGMTHREEAGCEIAEVLVGSQSAKACQTGQHIHVSLPSLSLSLLLRCKFL